MNIYRNSSVYLSSEVKFYLMLRAKQFVQGTDASATLDQVCDCDLRNLYTNDNPQWVELWNEREELRQKHKKEFEAIEAKAKFEPMIE